MYSILIDLLVMLLLLMTIFFCWRLNAKIVELRASRKDLLELIKTLDQAIFKTNSNIIELKSLSQNSAVGLNNLMSKAKININDLNFINETADKTANKLEKNIIEARKLIETINQTNKNISVNSINESHDMYDESQVSNFRSSFAKVKGELMSALRFIK